MSAPRLADTLTVPWHPGDLLTVRHGEGTVSARFLAETRTGKLRVRKLRQSGKWSSILTIDREEVVERV